MSKEIITERKRIGRVPTLFLRPKKIPQIPVALIWMHGGGYLAGMKEMVYGCRPADLLKRYGVMIVSPGYRLSWQKPYPAAINDCYEVLEYVNSHKQELGIKRIMLGGESAGGGLCAALSMMARDKGIPVSFQMPLYPMLDNYETPSSKNNHGKVWSSRQNAFAWKLYLRKDAKKEVSPYAAPARQTDYSSLPPCYTFVSDDEPFYAETLEYVKNLNEAGVQAAVDVYHTNVHAFDIFKPKAPFSIEAKRKLFEHFEYALNHYE